MERKITKIDDRIRTVSVGNLVPGRYYRWIERICSADSDDYYNYDNLEVYHLGQYIGMYYGTPVFKEDGETFEKAVEWSQCCQEPRYIYDALEAEMLKNNID